MTVSGNPASFVVRGAAAKVNSLTVPFSPIQSLNGYSHPWPAGGGKNKFITTLQTTSAYGTTFTVNADGSITVSGTPTQQARVSMRSGSFVDTSSVCIFSTGVIMPTGTRIFCLRNHEGTTTYPTISNTHTFTVGDTYSSMILEINTNYDGEPFTLYPMIEAGSTATSWQPYSNICPISGRTGLSVYVSPTQDQQDATTYAVDWTSEAGTVYGGTLDVVTGLLTVDRAIVDLGTLSASAWIYDSNRKGFTHSFTGPANANIMCSSYPIGVYADWANASKTNLIFYVKPSRAIYLKTPDYTDGASLSAALSGVQMAYELATPLTYQFTPQEVELFVGLNNVWSDTDSVITVDYDVLSFIKQKFIVNGTDFSRFVERDSYQTSLSPVYGETVQTIDGVGHTARLRLKGALRLSLNPQTDTDTAAICTELLNSPCEVIYHCLQRDADVAARMTIDTVSASFLSRCLYWGDEWNQIDPITLTEL